MDMLKKMLQERGLDITCTTQYVIQVKFPLGDWYTVDVKSSLDAAIEAREQEIDTWFKDMEDASYPVRIVMRHTVEVVL